MLRGAYLRIKHIHLVFCALILCLISFFYICPESYAISIKPVAIDSRIKTFIYSENEIFHLRFRVGYQSIVEFANDEEIELISLGDPFPWKLTPVNRRLFVKALDPNASTNMTIITNKRMYLFEIDSTDADDKVLDDDLVYVARFFYPDNSIDSPLFTPPDMSILGNAPNINPSLANTGIMPQNKIGGIGLDSDKKLMLSKPNDYSSLSPSTKALNFSYSFAGSSNNIIPIKVFDDGSKTFFQFKNKKNNLIPSFYAVNNKGEEEALTYKSEGDYIVINRVEWQFSLRMGNELVCVFNDAMPK